MLTMLPPFRPGPYTRALLELATPIHDHCVRKLRKLRQGGLSDTDLAYTAGIMADRLGVEADKILAESKYPGPTNGYPFLVSAELKAKRSDDHDHA